MTDTRKATYEEAITELRIFYAYETGRSLHDCVSLISPEMSFEQLSRLDSDLDWLGFSEYFGTPLSELLTGYITPQSTVREFAQYLAEKIDVPIPKPVTILGKQCLSAGLFLEIKNQLVQKGERENEISPSSKLKPFLVRHHDIFRKLRWYSPGKLSALKIRNPLAEWGYLTVPFWLITWAVYASITDKFAPRMPSVTLIAVLLSAMSACCIAVAIWKRERFENASFDGLTDFRSLVDALLDRPPSRSNQYKLASGNIQ